ncbi:histidine utilization repressor [Gellertiella hungarica]|uniref:Histidine utilization repressor n=1 Tax=Gellertiella hungarica TaxID=1572859 RepID=A0A7W6J8B7_9HYPH|nr:histidine utilization repressor [Gellertiella hungarica]MBB4066644.1 GntR family histidine utilization transcriptional repressor [Gellertiella hungarica]
MKDKKPAAATLHQQILSDIETRIVSGEWPPGHRLPFEVDLAKSYDVSRMTVNKVLTKLADAGLIERRKKSGSFVAQPQVQSAILEIHDIEAEVRSLKRDYRYRLVEARRRKASEPELAAFELAGKTDVLALSSVHYAGDMPFCTEERLIHLGVVPQAADVDFAQTPPGQWLRVEVPWTAAEHKIYATGARGVVAERLALPEGAPCLVVQRRTWSDQGPVTFVKITYPAETHAIVARFTPAQAGKPAL